MLLTMAMYGGCCFASCACIRISRAAPMMFYSPLVLHTVRLEYTIALEGVSYVRNLHSLLNGLYPSFSRHMVSRIMTSSGSVEHSDGPSDLGTDRRVRRHFPSRTVLPTIRTSPVLESSMLATFSL